MYSKQIREDLERFLTAIPRDRLALGPARAEATAVTPEILAARDTLVQSLDRRLSTARRFVAIIIGCYCIAFALATAYVITSWKSANLFYLIAGQSGSVVALIGILRSFWRDITALELLITFLPGVSPERAIEIVREWAYAKSARQTGGAGVSEHA